MDAQLPDLLAVDEPFFLDVNAERERVREAIRYSPPAALPSYLTGGVPMREPGESESLTTLRGEQYAQLFDRLLLHVAAGGKILDYIEGDGRGFEAARVMQWIRADRTRLGRFREAQAIGAELRFQDIPDIAEAKHSPEDVQRSALVINTLKWWLGVVDRQRYGDVKQVEISQSISIRAAMARAESRVIEGEVTREDDDGQD